MSAPARPVTRQPGRKVDYVDAAERLMKRCITDAKNNEARLDRDRADWQNLLMYRGGRDGQWSIFDHNSNSFVPRGTDPDKGGLPEWVPRPVTNVFAQVIDGIVSILDQSDPAKLWSPSTDDDSDRATAEVAEDADPVLQDEIGYDALRAEINKLVTLTNGAALILYYDTADKHGMEDIPLLRCPACETEMTAMDLEDAGNACPEEGCETPGESFEPVIDKMGTPQGIPYPKGKLCAQLCPSFEYSLPSSARTSDTTRNPWVLTHSELPNEEVIARFKGAKAAISGSRHGGKSGGLQRAYARQMRQLSSPTRARSGVMGGGSAIGQGTVVFILQHDPIDDDEFYFPDGLHAVMVEDALMEGGPLPVRDDEDRAVKSIIIRTFAHAPGTCYGKPPADDLVPLQITRNTVDSLIQLILMHDAAPRTFIPLSVTLENQPTGRPGETIFYRSMIPGEKPMTDRGINPPDGLYKYLEIIDSKFQEVSKLNSVLAGARPEGDPTLGEVQILQERGMASFKEPLDHMVRFERQLSLMLFWIAKRSAWSDRFRRVRGENGQWEISQFNAADLGGRVDVQVDKQTAWPKSPLTKLLRLGKAFEWGVLMPPAQDPELQTKLLLELDLIQMKPSMDVDRKQVARELDSWKAAHGPEEIRPPDPVTQNLPLHLHFKSQFLKTEEFEGLRDANPALAQAMVAHVQGIQQLMAQAQAAAAAAQAGPPPPDDRSAVEKGDHSTLDQAVDSGALRPAAGEPPPPDALAQAVDTGALVPAAAAQAAQPQGPSIDELMEMGALMPAPQESTGAPPAP